MRQILAFAIIALGGAGYGLLGTTLYTLHPTIIVVLLPGALFFGALVGGAAFLLTKEMK